LPGAPRRRRGGQRPQRGRARPHRARPQGRRRRAARLRREGHAALARRARGQRDVRALGPPGRGGLASMTATATTTRRSEDELRALAQEGAALFADGGSEAAADVLAWAARTFGGKLAVACSMAGDTVVVDLAAAAQPGVD